MLPVVNRDASGISVNAKRLRLIQCAPGPLGICWQDFFSSGELHFLSVVFSFPSVAMNCIWNKLLPAALDFSKANVGGCFTLLFENEGKPSFTSENWRKIGTDSPEDSCSQQLSGGWALSCLLSLSVFWTELNLQTVSLFGKFVFCFVF